MPGAAKRRSSASKAERPCTRTSSLVSRAPRFQQSHFPEKKQICILTWFQPSGQCDSILDPMAGEQSAHVPVREALCPYPGPGICLHGFLSLSRISGSSLCRVANSKASTLNQLLLTKCMQYHAEVRPCTMARRRRGRGRALVSKTLLLISDHVRSRHNIRGKGMMRGLCCYQV